MRADDLVLVQGARDTRAALTRWNAHPGRVLGPWVAVAAAVAVVLLLATWFVAALSTPDPTRLEIPGVTRGVTPADAGPILMRNGLVLALHAFACLAGFIAGSSLPREAERYSGFVAHGPRSRGRGGDDLRRRRDALLARDPGVRSSAARPRRWPPRSACRPACTSPACSPTRCPS